jgi:hypothetical protein
MNIARYVKRVGGLEIRAFLSARTRTLISARKLLNIPPTTAALLPASRNFGPKVLETYTIQISTRNIFIYHERWNGENGPKRQKNGIVWIVSVRISELAVN